MMLACLGWAGCPHAAQVSAKMNISATMVGSCTIAAVPMNFLTYDGSADVTATAEITSNCTMGQDYQIHLDAGSHFDGTSRRLAEKKSGAFFIAYQLYQGATAVPWGDSGNTGNVTTPWASMGRQGTGVDEVTVVTGKLFGGANVPIGDYSDVINVTVTY